MCRCLHHSPVSPALQKLLCPLYPSWQLCRAPPSSLQSLPHPDSQSRVSLALLKLPLGNLTPCTKPEMPEVPTRAHRCTHACAHKHGQTQTHASQLTVFWMWGSPGFYSPCSLLRQQDKWWLSDRRFTLQEPIVCLTWQRESGTHSFPPLSCRVSIHTQDHPIHPHLGDYTIFFPCHSSQYLQQHTSAQGASAFPCLHSY